MGAKSRQKTGSKPTRPRAHRPAALGSVRAPGKMSEQLGDAAKPWLDRLGGVPGRGELEFIYSVVGALWNVSRLPVDDRATNLAMIEGSVSSALPGLSSAEVSGLVREILARASRLYVADRRLVAKVSVMEMKNGLCHIVVASLGNE